MVVDVAAAAAVGSGSVLKRARTHQPSPLELLVCINFYYHWISESTTPCGGVVFKHGLVVVGQHLLQRARHRVAPQQVMIQRTICIEPAKRSEKVKKRLSWVYFTSYWGLGLATCQLNHRQVDPAVKTMKCSELKTNYKGGQTFTYGLSLSFTLRRLSPLGISIFRNKSSLDTPGQTWSSMIFTQIHGKCCGVIFFFKIQTK